jgi:hypothetical protein
MSDEFGDWDPAAKAHQHNPDPLDLLDEYRSMTVITVTRPSGDVCWEMTRPSNGKRTASPNFDYIAREAMHEVKRAGGQAIVVYVDHNDFEKRIQSFREGA